MNKYGARAMSLWERTNPQSFAEIPNPQEFFSTLGKRAEQQIQDLEAKLAGPDPPDEEYLEKVGRLNNARMMAEEQVLADLISPPPDNPEPESTEDHPLSLVIEVQRAIDHAAQDPDED